jgi:hypothetical protein
VISGELLTAILISELKEGCPGEVEEWMTYPSAGEEFFTGDANSGQFAFAET